MSHHNPRTPLRRNLAKELGIEPIELPEEFFENIDRAVLTQARAKLTPVRVAVVFLIRAGKPDSPVTWIPEFGDMAAFDEALDSAEKMRSLLHPGETLDVRVLKAQ